MKKKNIFSSLTQRRFFPPLMIALALAVGLMLPSAVLAVQGARLEKSDAQLPTGISLSRQSSEAAKLSFMSRFYSTVKSGEGEELELSRGRYMTAEQAKEQLSELKTIAEAAGLRYEAPPNSAKSSATPTLVLLSDKHGMTSSIIWVVQFLWDDKELSFIVDDETGMLCSGYAFFGGTQYETAYDSAGTDVQQYENASPGQSYDAEIMAQRLGEALCRSYGFETVSTEIMLNYSLDYYADLIISFIHDGSVISIFNVYFEGNGWSFGI